MSTGYFDKVELDTGAADRLTAAGLVTTSAPRADSRRRRRRRATDRLAATTTTLAAPAATPIAPAAPAATAPARSHPDDLLLEADGRSIPDYTAVSPAVGHAARTSAPIVLADLLALAAAGALAEVLLWLVCRWAGVAGGPDGPVSLLPLALLPLAAAYWFGDLYAEVWLHSACELRHLSRITTVGLLATAAGGAAAPAAGMFPIWCAVALPAALVMVPLMRAVARGCCAGRHWWGYPTLVVATGGDADVLPRTLLRDAGSGLRPTLLTDPTGRRRDSVLPVVNDRVVLESIVRSEGIRHAVVFLPDASARELEDVLDRYRGLVPHLLVLPDCPLAPGLWRAARHCGRPSGIEARNGLLFDRLRVAKRATDLALAAAALCAGLPLMIAIAVLVKATSRGALFYGHGRIGRHGKRFKAWKFRTMRADGDAVLRAHLAADPDARAEWDRDQKLRNDPRITRVGRLLRRTSLDELPQVWNVLRGEMSLVGPRPIVTDEVWRYDDVIRLYALVRPGITGLWQVSGRNETTYPERVALDQFYVRHWSPWLDLYILAKTVTTLVGRRGAY